MILISPEQRSALAVAGGSPIELADPETGELFVLVRADLYQRMRDLLAGHEQESWSKLARSSRERWAGENAS